MGIALAIPKSNLTCILSLGDKLNTITWLSSTCHCDNTSIVRPLTRSHHFSKPFTIGDAVHFQESTQPFTFLGYTGKVTYDDIGQEEYKAEFRAAYRTNPPMSIRLNLHHKASKDAIIVIPNGNCNTIWGTAVIMLWYAIFSNNHSNFVYYNIITIGCEFSAVLLMPN
jgi:hypothetical protein